MYHRSHETAAPKTSELTPAHRSETPEPNITQQPSHPGPLSRVAPGAGGAPRPQAQAAALSRASGGKLARTGLALLQLQRQYGNRYVQQVVSSASQVIGPKHAPVIQTKLVLGAANDKYEREADRVAQQVVSQTTASQEGTVQRQTRDGEETGRMMRKPAVQHLNRAQGDAVDAGVQQAIQQACRGSGQAIPESVRTPLEHGLGADLSAVRVHADGVADRLNHSLQARAFTTGQDIFFRRGEYNLGTLSGRRTLAHELTHVVQQAGSRPAQGQAPAVSTGSASPIQRLVSKEDFQKLAGEPSTKSKLDIGGGTYTDILKKLEEYEKAKNQAKKTETLNDLKTLCTKWINSHTRAVIGSGEREAKETKDLRKAEYIQGLLEEVKAELGEAYDASVETPTEITQQAAFEMQKATAAATLDLNAPPAARYALVLLASVENPDLLPFAEKRLELTIKNKTKIFGKQKSGKEIKKEAAARVVEEKGQVMTDEQKKAAIDKIVAASGEVGHTWVKLRKYDKDDKLLAEHSFGFYPLKGYNRPELAVPGEVVYGDQNHDKDPDQSAEYYHLTADQYSDALTTALGIMAKRPDYKLVDYNCTAFTKDVVEAAGQKFPGKAFMRVPSNAVSAVSGVGWSKAYNPNAVYGKMQPRASVYVPQGAQQLQGGVFSLGGVEEASQSENLVDILGNYIKEKLTLTEAIYASPAGRTQQVVIKAGTDIMLLEVSENYAKFDVARAGFHETFDLDELYAALSLGA